MKVLLYSFMSVLIFSACNKNNTTIVNNGLVGKWQLTESFISPGDAGAWHLAEGLHTIEFKSDGAFTSNDDAFNSAVAYYFVDSTHIKLVAPTQVTSETVCVFSIDEANTTLTLYPVNCIEGCSSRYKAVSAIEQ